jgi:sugar phosphate isomerase/epimerase
MNNLSVSTFSLREQTGPLYVHGDGRAGKELEIGFPIPKLVTVSKFPQRARDLLGIECMETTTLQLSGLDDPEIDLLGKALASTGVRLLNVNVNAADLLDPDDVARARGITVLERWIARLAGIGAEFVRVNPGAPSSPHVTGADTPPAHLVDALGQLGTYAASHGARLLVENHGGDSSNPVWMRHLVESVGGSACGLLLDLGNFEIVTGPIYPILFKNELADHNLFDMFADIDLEPVYAAIESLASLAELVSLKVHQVGGDGAVGPVDIERSIRTLAAHGYGGALSVEYEGTGGDPWHNCRQILNVARSTLASLATAEAGR